MCTEWYDACNVLFIYFFLCIIQKLQERIRIERSKEDNEQIRISKHVVNNEIVGKLKDSLNEAFKFSPIQYIKDMLKKD